MSKVLSFCHQSSVYVGGRAGSPLRLFLFSFCHQSSASVRERAGSPLPPCLSTNNIRCCVVVACYPLGQGQAIVRLQPTHAYSTSALYQYKPQLLYIPPPLVPDTAQTTITAELTACNTTHILFICTETWWQ